MGKYDDIIHLSRPKSRRARMSMIDRGAQFSPFAALVGYEAVIQETARMTEEQTELSDSAKELLNRKLQLLSRMPEREAAFVCFFPDERKDGGSFVTMRGRVAKIDSYSHTVVLSDGREMEIEAIRAIEGIDEEEEEWM